MSGAPLLLGEEDFRTAQPSADPDRAGALLALPCFFPGHLAVRGTTVLARGEKLIAVGPGTEAPEPRAVESRMTAVAGFPVVDLAPHAAM